MHYHGLWMLCLVLALSSLTSLATGQAEPAAVPPLEASAGTAAKTTSVGPETPVVTVEGFCETAPSVAKANSPCQTVLTRSEYEGLAEAGGQITPMAKKQFVQVYIQYLLFAAAAQKQGLDKDPSFQRMLELARLKLLTQTLIRDLQARAEQISPEELEEFYRENPAEFEQAALLRIFIPRAKQADRANRAQEPIPGTEPEMKTLAGEIRARAVAGENFQTLQKEVLTTANLRQPLEVNLGTKTRDQLRRTHRGVFDLKPGEVSAVLEDPEGYYIYKVISKSVPPLTSVKDQAKTALQKRRMDTWTKDITEPAKVSLNEQYFGTAGAAKSRQTQ